MCERARSIAELIQTYTVLEGRRIFSELMEVTYYPNPLMSRKWLVLHGVAGLSNQGCGQALPLKRYRFFSFSDAMFI